MVVCVPFFLYIFPPMANFNRILTFFVGALIALHLWAALSPSHYNWGLHYFAFYPLEWSISALLAGLLVLIPAVRRALLGRLSATVRWFGQLPPALPLLGLLAIWVGMMFLLPAELHLLGDSELILQLTPKLPSIEDVSANFRNQPLTYQSLRLIQWIFGGGGALEPIVLYRLADGIAGIAYLLLVIYFLKSLSISAVDAVLLGILLLFRAGVQFFFGYVENYMFFYVAVSAYLITGWLALERKAPLWLPLAILVTVPGFHIAGLVFVPTGLLLFLPWWNSRRRAFLMAMAGCAAVGVAVIIILDPASVARYLEQKIRSDFLPLTTPPGGSPYGMFSIAHLVDWANAHAHIAPFSLACVVIGSILVPGREYLGNPVFRFLACAAGVGLAVSFVISPGLGMARDWDSLANFFTPLRLLAVYFLTLLLRSREVRHAVAMLCVVAIVRWLAWVGINADETRHLARAEVLTAPELSGVFPKLYYEHLAATLYKRKNYEGAVRWYERYMAIDSSHPRILANLSDCYRALGDGDNVFRMLRLSAGGKSTDPGVYSNLALEYATRGDSAKAISLLNEALRLDPGYTIAHANLGMLTLGRHQYRESLQHSVEAIRLGMTDPQIFRYAGYASYFLSEYPAALKYLERYLSSAPNDVNVRELVDEIARETARVSLTRDHNGKAAGKRRTLKP